MREEPQLVESVEPISPLRRSRRPRSRSHTDTPEAAFAGAAAQAGASGVTGDMADSGAGVPVEAVPEKQVRPSRRGHRKRAVRTLVSARKSVRSDVPSSELLEATAAETGTGRHAAAPESEKAPVPENVPVETARSERTDVVPMSAQRAGVSGETKVALPAGEVRQSLPEAPAVEEGAVAAVEGEAEQRLAAANGEASSGRKRRGRRGGRGKGKSRSRADATDILTPDLKPSEREGQEVSPVEMVAPDTDAAELVGLQESREKAKPRRRKMFISVLPDEQVEVVLAEEGAIHEYYLEMLHQAKTKGNIYKGIIHNIDPNLQAAFVSYGAGKNGFLQIDEIHPEYYLAPHEPMKGKKFPPIQKVLRPGQEVLVQVVKEPTGNKGAFLTTWLSLAGRFLVLTPGQEQIGVSRKVEDDEERARLRELINGIDPGEGLGVIVRTVSAGTSKTTLKTDLQYLKRLWKDIRKRGTTEPAPTRIYQEPGLPERAVRDYLTDDVCEVWVDNATLADSLRETISLLFPRRDDIVRVHLDQRQTLWERFNIQRQLEQIYSREVSLPSGGRLVFDQTEALMAIDINSGKISGKGNFEAMAFKTNLEAAETIARHLKLRDIGGQIVIDFIEMRDKNHIREVEKTLRTSMKSDRARHDVARMSSFGLLEVVRQRTGSSALAMTMEPCPVCGGTGLRRTTEWQALQALRDVDRQMRSSNGGKCVYETSAELGMYLLNHKREHLRTLEQLHHTAIEIALRP